MAVQETTGTYSWNLNTYKIISGSLRLLGAIQTGESVEADEYEDCLEALNALTKHLQSSGIHVWSEVDVTLFLQPGQNRYVIGQDAVLGPSTDHWVNSYAWGQVALAATAATGATSIVLSSTTFTPTGGTLGGGYTVGIWLDAGTTFWASSVSLTGSTLFLDTPLPSQASSGAQVVCYRVSSPTRPLKVPAARRYQFAGPGGTPIETPLMIMSRIDYANTPNKNTTGIPTQWFYDPSISSGTWIVPYSPTPGAGQFFVWPTPVNNLNAIKFTAQRPLQDFTTQANYGDLPQEWISTLRYLLAVELAPEYDCTPPRFEMLKLIAAEKLETSKMFDRESEPVMFGVASAPGFRS